MCECVCVCCVCVCIIANIVIIMSTGALSEKPLAFTIHVREWGRRGHRIKYTKHIHENKPTSMTTWQTTYRLQCQQWKWTGVRSTHITIRSRTTVQQINTYQKQKSAINTLKHTHVHASVSRLWAIVSILLAKKCEEASWRWEGWMADGRDKDSDLPRRVFVMLYNCLEVEHARILVL